MPDGINPYTAFEPGQLITAEVMNEMQDKIRADIAAADMSAFIGRHPIAAGRRRHPAAGWPTPSSR